MPNWMHDCTEAGGGAAWSLHPPQAIPPRFRSPNPSSLPCVPSEKGMSTVNPGGSIEYPTAQQSDVPWQAIAARTGAEFAIDGGLTAQ